MRMCFIFSLFCSVLFAQDQTARCELAVVDVDMANQALEALTSGRLTPQEIKEKYAGAQQAMGKLDVPVQEDESREKSFPIPETSFHASARVAFSDEMGGLPLMVLTLAASEAPAEQFTDEEDNATTQVNFTPETRYARLSKRMKIEGRVLSLSLVCGIAP